MCTPQWWFWSCPLELESSTVLWPRETDGDEFCGRGSISPGIMPGLLEFVVAGRLMRRPVALA
jgi:hypothetical protein